MHDAISALCRCRKAKVSVTSGWNIMLPNFTETLPKNDFTRKMNYFDTFIKIA